MVPSHPRAFLSWSKPCIDTERDEQEREIAAWCGRLMVPQWASLHNPNMYVCIYDDGPGIHLRSSSSKAISGSSSSGTGFCLLLRWNLLSVTSIHSFLILHTKYGLVSNQTLALVCPLVFQRVMKSVFLFLQLWASPPAIGLQPACVPCRSCPQAQRPSHQLSTFFSTHFCFPTCSKSWLAHLSPFSPCLWSVWFPSLPWAELLEVQGAATSLTHFSKPGFRTHCSRLN